MPTRSEIYWRDRINQEMAWAQERGYEEQKQVQEIYETSLRSIEDDINAFFNRYAGREGISRVQAKRRADVTDLNILSRKAQEYVENKDFSDRANMMLKNYNLKGRVSREELLKHRIDLALHELGHKEETLMRETLNAEFTRQLEINAGIWEMSVPEVDTLKAMSKAIENKPFKGSVWSDRLWDRQDSLANKLSNNIERIIMQGRNATTLISEVRSVFGVSEYEAKRLLVTETARMQTESQRELMAYNDFEEYEFLAEPGACEACAALDGQNFPVEDMQPGLNAAPIHPNCRCSSAPNGAKEREKLEQMVREQATPANGDVNSIEDIRQRVLNSVGASNLKEIHPSRYEEYKAHLNTITDPDILKMYEEYGEQITYGSFNNRAYYSPLTRTVSIQDGYFIDSKNKKAYSGVHHENGHAFDNLAFKKLKGKDYEIIDGKRVWNISGLPEYDLENKTYNDLWKYINGDLKQLSDLGNRPRKKAEKAAWDIERMHILQKARENTQSFTDKINKFKNESEENERAVFILSDVVESTRMLGDRPFGSGHDSKYWTRDGNKEAEFFAHATSSRADDEVTLNLLQEIFPESMATYDQMVKDITGGE